MTALTKTKCSIIEWEVEDYLDSHNVFLNGFREGEVTASLGAYGTVISHTNLIKAFDAATFTKEQWLKCIEHWRYNAYLAPTFELLARFMEFLVENKFGK
jgi:hypothetical protein